MSSADDLGPSRDADFHENSPTLLPGRRRHPVLRRLLFLAAVLIVGQFAANVWTSQLWFDNLGFKAVYRTELITRTALFALAFVLTEVLCHVGVWMAYRYRPLRVPDAAGEAMHRYRVSIEPFRRSGAMLVVPMFALLVAVSAAGQWRVPLLWWGRTSFGATDPQFGRDIGFYVFTMPLIEMVIGFATVILVLSLVLAGLTHYIYGGILLRDGGLRATRLARTHLGLLIVALLLVRAAGWWWGRYALVYKSGRAITGVDSTSVSATLPIHEILAVCAVLTALLFLVLLRSRNWRLPTTAIAMLSACAVIFGGLYPDVIGTLRANGPESEAQASYVQREIDGTRAAYGVSGVTADAYAAGSKLPAGTTAAELAKQVGPQPLLDPVTAGGVFQKLKATPPASFDAVLDTGRTGSGAAVSPTVVGARTIDPSEIPKQQNSWVGRHLVYTHSTGVISADATIAGGGSPSFVTTPEAARSRIYFGSGLPSYSVVGGKAIEADGDKTTGYRYDGTGGVALGGIMRRVAYAASFRSVDMLTSRSVSTTSRVIYNRDPVDRVRQVAPWLSVDQGTYPVQAGGRTLWVVDGYTTSARYPYSRAQELPTAPGVTGPQVNYVRSAVKATVDAYDGTVRLYTWDAKDPILRAWQKVFPGSLLPRSQMPAQVASQLRYPQAQFEMQRSVLAVFRHKDRASFVAEKTSWALPLDPTSGTAVLQPSRYQPVTLPGATSPTYGLSATYVDPGEKGPLTGFVVADGDGSASSSLHLLQVSGAARSPQQFQDDLLASVTTSSSMPGTLQQFFEGRSREKELVIRGSVLTVPAAGGMVQIEPLFVRADGDKAYPVLKAVVVGYGAATAKGGKIAWGSTLEAALADLATAK